MIVAQNVTKRYGKVLANDDVNLTVNPGELVILLGPNGAGKSTIIKSICGLLRYKGTITVGGVDNRELEAKRLLGYVPEIPALYSMLTVWEHMEFIAKAYRLDDWQPFAEELLLRFDMTDKKDKLGKELSKGMQQKVNICCALLPKPKAVILDEPLVGLDPHGIREIKTMISDLRKSGCALLVSTHIIDSMEEEWDVTYIMNGGRVVDVCRRDGMPDSQSLEDVYFSIIKCDQATVEEKSE
jgi:ABC-type multidrug transport system ATPase subunit